MDKLTIIKLLAPFAEELVAATIFDPLVEHLNATMFKGMLDSETDNRLGSKAAYKDYKDDCSDTIVYPGHPIYLQLRHKKDGTSTLEMLIEGKTEDIGKIKVSQLIGREVMLWISNTER